MAEIPDLNLLRGIAASLVLVSHARPFAFEDYADLTGIAVLCAYTTALILYFIGEKHHQHLRAAILHIVRKRIGNGT